MTLAIALACPRSRAFPIQLDAFDRDDFAPWQGAARRAMWGIVQETQRHHSAKGLGLRWRKSARRVRCGAYPISRIAFHAAPARTSRFAAIKCINLDRKGSRTKP